MAGAAKRLARARTPNVGVRFVHAAVPGFVALRLLSAVSLTRSADEQKELFRSKHSVAAAGRKGRKRRPRAGPDFYAWFVHRLTH